MRSHFLPVWSLLLMCGASPIHALAQADCSQREWRLLSDYDPLLMKAFEALDWKRYATLQRQLLAQLSRNCLVALGQQQQVQREEGPDTASSSGPRRLPHGGETYSAHELGTCALSGCMSH